MKYPYRVKVFFNENTKKLQTIMAINHFLIHDAKGKWDRYNIQQTVKDERMFVGLELAFAESSDAVHFKLGFDHETES